ATPAAAPAQWERLAPEPAAWLVSPGQDFALQRPPQPQAQPKAESFSSVWLLENSGSVFSGNRLLQTLSSNCIPPGPHCVRILLWNAGLPGRAGIPSHARWSIA